MTAKTYLLGGAAAFALLLAGCGADQASTDETATESAAATTETTDEASPAFDEAAPFQRCNSRYLYPFETRFAAKEC